VDDLDRLLLVLFVSIEAKQQTRECKKTTHKFLAQNAGRVLDLLADDVEILADVVRPLVRRLVEEDAFDVDAVAGGLVVFRPAAVTVTSSKTCSTDRLQYCMRT
jgi:hypothetical protein